MDANRAICLDVRAFGSFLPSSCKGRVYVLLGHEQLFIIIVQET